MFASPADDCPRCPGIEKIATGQDRSVHGSDDVAVDDVAHHRRWLHLLENISGFTRFDLNHLYPFIPIYTH